MNIVYCTNDKYALYSLISIISCIEHNNKPDIYLIYVGLLFPYDISIINNYYQYEAVKIVNVDIDINIEYCHPMAYVRYQIPSIFKSFEKVLYIDTDTIVLDDLTDLYNTDVNCLGACDSIKHYNDNIEAHPFNVLRQPRFYKKYKTYFNTGILLFNIKYWNNNNIYKQLVNEQNMHPDLLADQDSVNTVLNNIITELPLEYNYKVSFWSDTTYMDNIKNKNILLGTPKILHYASKIKPWDEISWKGPWIEYYNKICNLYNIKSEYELYDQKLINYINDYQENYQYKHMYNMCYNSPFSKYNFEYKTLIIEDTICDKENYLIHDVKLCKCRHKNEIHVVFQNKHNLSEFIDYIYINYNKVIINQTHYIKHSPDVILDTNNEYYFSIIGCDKNEKIYLLFYLPDDEGFSNYFCNTDEKIITKIYKNK